MKRRMVVLGADPVIPAPFVIPAKAGIKGGSGKGCIVIPAKAGTQCGSGKGYIVIPAKAGIQGGRDKSKPRSFPRKRESTEVEARSCHSTLDSRFRGNDDDTSLAQTP